MAEEPKPHARSELRLVSTDEPVASNVRIDMREIFRSLILDEIRRGGLTKTRRRRIVQYAAHLNLSAVQVGQMIATCRDELLRGDDPADRSVALALAQEEEKSAARASNWAMFGGFTLRGLTIGLWLLAGLLTLVWLRG